MAQPYYQSDEYKKKLQSQMKDGDRLVMRECVVNDAFTWEWTIIGPEWQVNDLVSMPKIIDENDGGADSDV